MNKRWLAPAGIAVAWGLPAALLTPRFPTVFIDEAENANHAYNLAFHHTAVFSLYDQLYPPTMALLRQAWPVVIRPFFTAPLALYFHWLGFGFIKGRLFDVAVGAIALGLFYAVSRLALGQRAALFAAAVLGTRFAFLYCTHTIRPEALLCLCGIAMMGCLYKGLENRTDAWLWPAGILAGAAGGIHTNGIWFAVPCLALPLIEKRWRAAACAAAGWILGLTAFVHFADWDRFIPGVQTLFFREFAAPPIRALHGNVFAALANEFERYQGVWIFSQWHGGQAFQALIGWQLLLYVAALCWAFTQSGSIRRWAWAAALLALAYALGVGQKAYNYTTALEPFFILPLAAWLARDPLDWTEIVIGILIVSTLLPAGLLPVIVIPAFFLLQRRTAHWVTLGLLVCLFLRIATLQIGLREAQTLTRSIWPMMAISCLLLLFAFVKPRRVPLRLSSVSLARGVLSAVTIGTLFFVLSVWRYEPSFPELSRSIAAQMSPGARVAGPQELWLGLSDFDYRDIGGLMWYRLLLGQKDFLRPLEALHPTYLIIDPTMAARLRHFNADRHVQGLRSPTQLFPWPHHVIHVWATGPAYGNEWALIENDWASDRPRGKK